MTSFHKPVLLKEAIDYLKVVEGEKYIDATVGGAGHAQKIVNFGGKILGIDFDPEAIKAARKCLSTACPTPEKRGPNISWRLVQGNFVHLKKIAQENNFTQVAGIIFDLGVSSYQLETPERGFSFNLEGPLDMRMDPTLTVTAADLVNGLSKDELTKLFTKLGDEQQSRRIAVEICSWRRTKQIKTGKELAKIVLKARSEKNKFERIHPATRCFQALRIAVNDELNNLRKALPQAVNLLKKQGRLVIISFHSGEDRVAKDFFLNKKSAGKLEILTKKPITPHLTEIKDNPRSRSAKLRAAEKK